MIHEQNVFEFFRGVHSKRLLVYDITKHSGKDIAKFLPELKFSDLSMPHAHKGYRSK